MLTINKNCLSSNKYDERAQSKTKENMKNELKIKMDLLRLFNKSESDITLKGALSIVDNIFMYNFINTNGEVIKAPIAEATEGIKATLNEEPKEPVAKKQPKRATTKKPAKVEEPIEKIPEPTPEVEEETTAKEYTEAEVRIYATNLIKGVGDVSEGKKKLAECFGKFKPKMTAITGEKIKRLNELVPLIEAELGKGIEEVLAETSN